MPRFVNPNPYHTPQQPQPTPGIDPTGGATIDALLLRAKQAREAQSAAMPAQIASPWQGASMMVNRLAEGMQARGAEAQASAGRAELAKQLARRDPVTGLLPPDAQGIIMTLDPDVGKALISDDINYRREQAKPLTDQGKLNADLKAGRITQDDYDTAMAGGKPKLTDIASLRGDYDTAAKTYDSASPAWEDMKRAASVALDPNNPNKGAATYAMVVGYAKLLDPNSVVREGEVKSATNLGGWLDTVNGWLAKAKDGSLDAGVMQQIMEAGGSRMQAYYDQVKTKRDWLTGVAKRHNMLPEDVVAPLGEFGGWKSPEQQAKEDAANRPQTPPLDQQEGPPMPMPNNDVDYKAGVTYADPQGNVGTYIGGDPAAPSSWKNRRRAVR